MRSLLWSEWRSKRLWGLALAAAVIVPILLGDPFTFWGYLFSGNAREGWFYLSEGVFPALVIALLFGAMAFAGELGTGTQDFLMSRPVSWKKLLAAKLIVGIGMLVGTGLVAPVVFRLMCPAPYLPFLTFARIGAGIASAVLAMTVTYLAGVACSVALPGAVGSVLTMLVIAMLAAGQLVLMTALFRYYELVMWVDTEQFMRISIVPWAVGPLLAALVIVRFGLTLSLAQRVRRYAFVMLGSVVCLTTLALALYLPKPKTVTSYVYDFSPDLSTALVSIGTYMDSTDTYFWRISDGQKRDIPIVEYYNDITRWLNNDTAIFMQSSGPGKPESVATMRLDQSGRLEIKAVPVGYNTFFEQGDFISPDGEIVALIKHVALPTPVSMPGATPPGMLPSSMPHSKRQYRFLDIKLGKWLEPTTTCPPRRWDWWQNDRTYAWLDEHKNPHIIRVR